MPCWVFIEHRQLPRYHGVHLVLDIARPGPDNWGIAVTYKGQTYASAAHLDRKEALVRAEEQESMPGPEGDTSWSGVLARLTGKVEPPGQWVGSPGEYASRFFAIGSWNWIVTLIAMRNRSNLRAAA